MKTNALARIVTALLLGAAALSAADAGTVKYYSRQRLGAITPPPSYTYAATYGAFGTCTGSSQSAPVATCTRNDGKVVDNSFCTAKTQACSTPTYVCGSWTGNAYVAGGGTAIATGVASDAAAATICQAQAAKTGLAGACLRETANQYNVYYAPGAGAPTIASYYHQDVSYCTKQ